MKKLFLFLAINITVCSHSQNSKLEYGLYNIGLGGFVGGFGALINKTDKDKPFKTFTNGFLKGSLGGGFIQVSKLCVGEISSSNNYSYSWLAKINNSFGTSIVENATMNKPFFSKFHINILGFNRIELHRKKSFKLKYKLMPLAFLMNSYVATKSKFEWNKIIKTGEMVFSSNKISDNSYRAFTLGTTIVMNSNFLDNKSTFSHEPIHVYQYYDYNFINSLINKPLNNLTSKSEFISKLDFLYYDLQYPFLLTIYSLEKSKDKYYDNFFEKEAGIFSNTLRDY